MKKVTDVLLVILVGVALAVGYACPIWAADKPITLKVAVFTPHAPGGRFDNVVEYCKRVTEHSNGELILEFIGGAEAIPTPQQYIAVRKGVLDICWSVPSLYQRSVPETISFSVSEVSAAEERANGFNDYINKLHEKLGLVYLGRSRGDGFFWTTNKLIKDPRTDFKGLKFAVIGRFWNSFAEKLGILPANIPIAERYTAMERGVIDGVGIAVGAASRGHGEVTKYYIDHGFLKGGSGITLINRKSWNSLPKHLQTLITEEFIRYENELPAYWDKKFKKERAVYEKQGMKFIKFSPEDAEWYIKTAADAKWEELKKACSPESYRKLREMLTKK